MRALPAGYRTASPDGKVITVYFGNEKIAEVEAEGTDREQLLEAEELAVNECEEHAAAVESGKIKPAARERAENKQILALQGELAAVEKYAREAHARAEALAAENEELKKQVAAQAEELDKAAAAKKK